MSTRNLAPTEEEVALIYSKRAPNSPNLIHNSLLTYLKTEFVNGWDWEHPTTGEVFAHKDIKRALDYYKNNNREGYKSLWCLWITGASRSFIASQFNISPSTLRRRWDTALKDLLLLLVYPELTCEELRIYAID